MLSKKGHNYVKVALLVWVPLVIVNNKSEFQVGELLFYVQGKQHKGHVEMVS